jgi:predicted component of type VI protein secretion system
MPAQLLALNEGPSILLDKPILLLGRDLECDIRLDSRKISRRHCCIAQVTEKLIIRDLGSTNGVRINGVRVIEGQLKSGDELMIGNFRYRVRWDPASGNGQVAAPSAEKAKPAPAPAEPPSEDELLEACEEPVPLADAQNLPAPVPVGKAHGPLPEPAANAAFESIIPDEIELAPASDDLHMPISPPSVSKTNHHSGHSARTDSDNEVPVEAPSK